jgi:oligopeptide transport system ATP-binding protein
VQAQIMELLRNLRDEKNLALVLITHDLGVVAGSCDRVAVMYAGRMVERAPVLDVFARPSHPYTRALLACLPRLDQKHDVISSIGGTPPNPADLPPGCPFAPRCPLAVPSCSQVEPALEHFGVSEVACPVVTGGSPAELFK